LRSAAAGLQDAEYQGIGRENADSNRERYRNAENERHEERNHGQPPLLNSVFRCRKLDFGQRGFFNLTAFPSSASGDPDAPETPT
jgi:hypothetical protein